MTLKTLSTAVSTIFIVSMLLFDLQGQSAESTRGAALTAENRELVAAALEDFFAARALSDDDDFKLWLAENVPRLSYLVEQVTKEKTGERALDLLAGVAFDDSAILNSVARVVTERFEEAVNSYFFETLRQMLNSDPLLGALFPNTKKTLNTNETNNFDLKHLAHIFEKDFQGIVPRFFDYVEHNMQPTPDNIRRMRIARLLYSIYEQILEGRDPIYIFVHLDSDNILDDSEASCMSAGLRWLKLIGSSDIGAMGDESFAAAMAAYILFRIEMETNQDAMAAAYGIEEEELLDNDLTLLRLEVIDQIAIAIWKYTDTMIAIFHRLEKLSAKTSTLDSESKPNEYLLVTKTTFEILGSTKTLVNDISKVEDRDSCAECDAQIGFLIRTAEYLLNRQYSAVLSEFASFLAELYEERVSEEDRRELESSAVVKNLIKYGNFIATVATNSDDPDALDQAIRSVFPPLSPYAKKTSEWGLYVNAYVGIDFGVQVQGSFDNFFSSFDFGTAFYTRLKAPIGIEFSFRGIPKILTPIGLFAYPIDLGNLVNYYLQQIGSSNVDFSLDQAFAPGFMLFAGLGNSPFIFGFGYQWAPPGSDGTVANQHRLSVSLCVDIPLVEIYRSR